MSFQPTHGLTDHPEYRRWHGMMARCYNPKNPRYRRYGGRGITVSAEWHDIKAFIKWALANGADRHLTIERKDNNGNYCPDNCCFIPWHAQAKNKHTARLITAFGKSMPLGDWAKITGIPYSTIRTRLRRGWTPERILSPSSGSALTVYLEVNGEIRRRRDIEKSLGLAKGALRYRLKRMSVADAVSRPRRNS